MCMKQMKVMFDERVLSEMRLNDGSCTALF